MTHPGQLTLERATELIEQCKQTGCTITIFRIGRESVQKRLISSACDLTSQGFIYLIPYKGGPPDRYNYHIGDVPLFENYWFAVAYCLRKGIVPKLDV